MFKVFIEIKPGLDKFDVNVAKYSCSDGKLVESLSFSNVKQIRIAVKEVTISRQLSADPFVLIIDSNRPVVDLRSNGILIIRDEG